MVLLRLISRFYFINPVYWFKKSRITASDELTKATKEVQPILRKFGEVLSTQPELVQSTLKKVSSTIESIENSAFTFQRQSTHTGSRETDYQHNSNAEDSDHNVQRNPRGFEQQIKNLFDEINIAQFTGNKIANQISSLVDKGIKFTHQLSDTLQSNTTEYVQEELQTTAAQTTWIDFINGLDELSLKTELLQAHVNQLMSSHEFN